VNSHLPKNESSVVAITGFVVVFAVEVVRARVVVVGALVVVVVADRVAVVTVVVE